MGARKPERGELIRALGRGLEVLSLFSSDRTELSLTEVAAASDLPVPTAQRILRTLESYRFVHRRGERGPYVLGPALLPLVAPLFASLTAPGVARPYLDELAAQTGEASNLAVLDGAEVLYIASSSTQRLLATNVSPGVRLPAHCTALGKVLLSQLSDEQARAALGDEPYEQRTATTRTTWADLAPDLERIRDDGYATSVGEYEEGLAACAVPVAISWDAPAGVNLSAPTSRWSATHAEQVLLPALREAARGIEEASAAVESRPHP